MAVFIALALFFMVGRLIAGCIDRKTDRQFRVDMQNENQIELFFANLYAVAWDRYQKLEPQAISVWIESGHKEDPYNNIHFFREFQEQVFGEPAEHKAIRVAWEALRDSGADVYVPNPDLRMERKSGQNFLPAKGKPYLDVEGLLKNNAHTMFRMPELYHFYDFNYAVKANTELAFQCMPEIDDPRATHCQIGSRIYERYSKPGNYDYLLEQSRSMNYGKRTYQL